MHEDGLWVGGGGFKVDREKALKKLQAFGLGGPQRFLECWLRAAAANEATRIDISFSSGGFEMSFDGRGFTREELLDPYGVLFEKQKPASADKRYLAFGIITLLPGNPGAIDLFYGAPGLRCRTTISRLQGEKTVRVEEDARGTRIRVVTMSEDSHLNQAAASAAAISLMHPARVFINGKEAPRLPACAGEPGVWVEERGFRAWLELPADDAPGSLVELFADGTALERVRMDEHDIRVRAFVEARGLALNAGHSRAVKDGRCRAVSGKIQAAAKELVVVAGKRLREDFDKDAWNARAVLWLRDLADRMLLDAESDAADPLKRALWNCPLHRTAGGEVLSLLDIRAREEKDGKVRYILSEAKPGNDESGALWCRDRGEFNSLVARFALEAQSPGREPPRS